MDDLISRSALLEVFSDKNSKQCEFWHYGIIQAHIKTAPTIDAATVVRCKDCEVSQQCIDDNYVWCSEWHEEMEKDGFCHRGRKRNGA